MVCTSCDKAFVFSDADGKPTMGGEKHLTCVWNAGVRQIAGSCSRGGGSKSEVSGGKDRGSAVAKKKLPLIF